jgi:hypothetical protein
MRALCLIRESSKSYECNELCRLSKSELISNTAERIKSELAITTDVIRHISEINRRKLFLDYGYSSLFDMLTNYFGYCRGSAQLRINAMRLINELPEVEEKIESGKLSLTAASQVQGFFVAEKKEQKNYSPEQKLELVEKCEGKSTRKLERDLATLNPKAVKRESVRAITESQSRLSISISHELLEKLENLKALLSHSNSNMSFEELFERLAEMGLEKLDPIRKAERAGKRFETKVGLNVGKSSSVHAHEPNGRSRYIPAAHRHAVWIKNGGSGCEFVEEATGKRCCSKAFLQIDHKVPFSRGGENKWENLRVLCGRHNRWAYKKFRELV